MMEKEKIEGIVLEGKPNFIDMPKDGQPLKEEDMKNIAGGMFFPYVAKKCPICKHEFDFSIDRAMPVTYEGFPGWPYLEVTCSQCRQTHMYLNPDQYK